MNSTQAVTKRLTIQLSDRRKTPPIKPNKVAAIIPNAETKTVFRRPTINARPKDDCEVYSISL